MSTNSKNATDGVITILNVGTKILLKDLMDQYIRTLGDYRTRYASNMKSALRLYMESHIQVVITEITLEDGTAYRLLQELGGIKGDDLYVIVALEERKSELLALVDEIEAHSVLIRPFSARELKVEIDRYKAWRKGSKEAWQLLVLEGERASRAKRFREAEVHFQDAVTVAPTNPTVHYKAALFYLAKPDFKTAEDFLKQAISIRPHYAQALSALGSLYLKQGELAKAEAHLLKAHEISPMNPDRVPELVRLYIERATEICKQSLRLDAHVIAVHYLLGKLLAFQKDYAGAVRELERVIPQLNNPVKNEAQTTLALARKLGSLA